MKIGDTVQLVSINLIVAEKVHDMLKQGIPFRLEMRINEKEEWNYFLTEINDDYDDEYDEDLDIDPECF